MAALGTSSASSTPSGPSRSLSRAVAAFAIAGPVWIAGGLVASADPEYWSPGTAIGYAAVGLYSLGLLTTAVALVLLARLDAVRVHRAARAALLVGTIGGITAGLANFGEDWWRISELSWVYVAGVCAFYLGMLAGGLALAVAGRELRAIGVLLLIPLFSVALGHFVGEIVGGGSLLACAAVLGRFDQAGRVQAPNLSRP